MKRSLNFRGKAGRNLTLENLVASMKRVGKSDEEIIAAVKEIQLSQTVAAAQRMLRDEN